MTLLQEIRKAAKDAGNIFLDKNVLKRFGRTLHQRMRSPSDKNVAYMVTGTDLPYFKPYYSVHRITLSPFGVENATEQQFTAADLAAAWMRENCK